VRVETVLRDQRGALEKELNVMQAKSQGELQGIQMKVTTIHHTDTFT
jgi:hypothetical protein